MPRPRTRALVGFAAFGLLWGFWGAELPAIQSHAGVDDGQLGIALLCIGLGALASMRPTGALVDRFPHVLPVTVALLGAAAIGPALATSAPSLAATLLILGACSGAMDVAINAEAADAESHGDPLMNLAHGAFSASVVVSSVLVGLLRELDASPAQVLGLAAGVLLVVAVVLYLLGGRTTAPAGSRPPRASLLRIAERITMM